MPDALDAVLGAFVGRIGKHDDQLAAILALPAPVGIGDVARYDHDAKQWHLWNDVVWAPDAILGINESVRLRALAWIGSGVLSGEDLKNIMPLLDVSKKAGVLKSLSAMPNIAIRSDKWDTDPNLMAFKNGVLDLKSGEFGPGRPEDLVSRMTNVEYRTDADPGLFYEFVLGIMGGDVALAHYLIAVLGYSLIGWQREQKFWMFVGPGQNGKGVLTRTVSKGLGTYSSEPPSTLYMRTKMGAAASNVPRPEILRLSGVRLTVMSEPQGGQFNEALIKEHTGNDKVEARDLYAGKRDIVSFYTTHTIIFLTNRPPQTEDVGPSMRRRVRIVQFGQDYTDPKRNDPTLEDRLQEDAALEGMMLLLTAAAKDYYDRGLNEPAQVTAWSDEYIEDNDPLAQYIQTACRTGKGERGSAALMWASYQDWCAQNDIESGSQMGFGLALGRRFKKTHTRNGWVYDGIRAKNAMDLAEEADRG